MSELYKLPKGWKWKQLGDISTLVGGGTPKRNMNEYWDNGNIVWLSPTDLGKIGDIIYISDSKDKITQLGLDKSSAKLLPVGTVLYSSRATIGKIAINTIEVSTNQGFTNFICNENLNNRYLAYILSRFTPEITSLSNSTTFKEVSKTSLKKFKIPLPPLQEQKRIVTKLDTLFEKIDKAIALHQKNMDEADAFMGSVLNDVFVELEEKYEKVKLGTITTTTSGGTPKRNEKSYWGGKIGWLKSGELNNGYITEVQEFITEEGLKKSSAKLFPKGTLLIAMYGATVGKLGILDIQTTTNQAICGVLNDKNLFETKYMFYFFQKSKEKMLLDSTGGAQPNISQTYLKQLEVILPPLNIQQKTVTYLDEISQKIEKIKSVQKEKMESLVALKASILDQAFRGKL